MFESPARLKEWNCRLDRYGNEIKIKKHAKDGKKPKSKHELVFID